MEYQGNYEMNSDGLGEKIGRGKRAELLLEDDLVKGIFDELHDAIEMTWLHTKVAESDARERCWGALQMLMKLREMLQRIAADGRIAQADVDRMMREQS